MKRTIIKTNFPFNHCATICCLDDIVVTAHYAGSGECVENQHVVLTAVHNGKLIDQIHLENEAAKTKLLQRISDVIYGRADRKLRTGRVAEVIAFGEPSSHEQGEPLIFQRS